jgi:peptide/nickel transport system substrate-binding protein
MVAMLRQNKERNMKAKRTLRSVALLAAGLLATSTAVSLAATSANAAAKSTVIINETTAMTSLNSGTPDTNLVTNTDIGYLTSAGFWYYDNGPNLIRNTKFGTFAITKNAKNDFQVTYRVNKGQVWSDGADITAADLLLSHILNSSAYSKKAGLGDPAKDAPAFNSGGYGGAYDSHAKSVALSSDGYSLTVKYDSFQPDWQILGPGPAPVHALELMADGKTTLQSASVSNAATDQFVADFNAGLKGKNARLAKMGAIWSEDYNIQEINSKTNPLLLVSNGGFIVDSAIKNTSVTLVRNDKYTSGPSLATKNPINKVIFTFVTDGAPAAQALGNGEIDVYDGQPDTATYQQLKQLQGVNVELSTTATFEHVDLRVGNNPGSEDKNEAKYDGPFAESHGQKAQDLRRAFLLALPRQTIVNKMVSQAYDPSNQADATVMNSSFLLPAQAGYNTIVNGSGVKDFTEGTQAQRTAAALKLVQKWYPKAEAGSNTVPINMLFKNNARRIGENLLIAAEEAKAGFKVSNVGNASWSLLLDDPKYDVAMFAWAPSSVSQTGTNANFQSDGSNNHYGWNSPALDKILKSLEAPLSDSAIIAKYLAAEKIINANAWTLPLYQWPQVTAYNSSLAGVKPGPLIPNVVWNYWQWHF